LYKKWILAFVDPSTSEDALGWPIRNALYYLHKKYNVSALKILSFRGDIASSLIVDTELPTTSNYLEGKSVGWERNVQGKLGPRLADLGPLMDPAR
jgi:ubiquitin-like modifier-activating enzyme ATG7